MKQFILVTTCLFLQNSAWATVGGDWLGWGDWTYQGSGDHCDMHLIFKDSATSFERTKGSIECSTVGLDLGPQIWAKSGEDLLLDGVIVGKASGDHVALQEQYSETISIHTTMDMQARHLDYHEVWLEADGKTLYDIKGRLFLHDNLE